MTTADFVVLIKDEPSDVRRGKSGSSAPPIKIIFGIGPYGWLGLSVIASVVLIVNDLNSRPSFWRKNLGVILLFQFSCAVLAVAWTCFSILMQGGGIH